MFLSKKMLLMATGMAPTATVALKFRTFTPASNPGTVRVEGAILDKRANGVYTRLSPSDLVWTNTDNARFQIKFSEIAQKWIIDEKGGKAPYVCVTEDKPNRLPLFTSWEVFQTTNLPTANVLAYYTTDVGGLSFQQAVTSKTDLLSTAKIGDVISGMVSFSPGTGLVHLEWTNKTEGGSDSRTLHLTLGVYESQVLSAFEKSNQRDSVTVLADSVPLGHPYFDLSATPSEVQKREKYWARQEIKDREAAALKKDLEDSRDAIYEKIQAQTTLNREEVEILMKDDEECQSSSLLYRRIRESIADAIPSLLVAGVQQLVIAHRRGCPSAYRGPIMAAMDPRLEEATKEELLEALMRNASGGDWRDAKVKQQITRKERESKADTSQKGETSQRFDVGRLWRRLTEALGRLWG